MSHDTPGHLMGHDLLDFFGGPMLGEISHDFAMAMTVKYLDEVMGYRFHVYVDVRRY